MNRDAAPATTRRLPRAVWMLGWVSLLMDTSSEMIHSVLPLFFVTVLGASPLVLGVLEGIAEATAQFLKVFAGAVSDLMRRRKPMTVLGYGLAALTKPLFAVAQGATLIFTARIVDRIGKGIRGAPRDALIADLTPPPLRGAAFGLRQALDTLGAILGPLLAMAVLLAYATDYRLVFAIAIVPALAAVAVLVFGVREPESHAPSAAQRRRVAELGRLPRAFWLVAALGAGLSLARFSEAFLILRANHLGLAPELAPLVLLVMNVVYAATVYPLGHLSDRFRAQGHGVMLVAALAVLVGADLVLARATTEMMLWIGIVLWGLHMGASQGLLSRMVSDVAPAAQRGTAFGFFNAASGIAILMANVVAGWLWESLGPQIVFTVGAIVAAVTLATAIAHVAYVGRFSEDHGPQ